MIKTYLTKEEFFKDYKNIGELREDENTLVRMPRSLYKELDIEGADTPIYRKDIDDNTPVVRCVNCGSEVILENLVGQNCGYFNDDNIFHSMTKDNLYTDSYECQGCGEII